MNKSRFILFLPILLIFSLDGYSQKKKDEKTDCKQAPENLIIDGNLSDWKDSLILNNETHLDYSISNSKTTLFIALRNTDPIQLNKIMQFGISVAINSSERKKPAPTLTYPKLETAGTKGKPAQPEKLTTEEIQKILKSSLKRAKSIEVNDFEDLTNGLLSLNNDYGIRAASSFNEKNELEIEFAIPFNLIGLEASSQNPFYCNIKINSPERISYSTSRDYQSEERRRMQNRRRMGGRLNDGYSEIVTKNSIKTSSEFWLISRLSNPSN